MPSRADLLSRWLPRLVKVRPEERAALLWAFLYFFLLLAGYYILRPLRDALGLAGGVRNLPWLFTATFAAMLLAVPVFGAVVARAPRRKIIPIVYRFFAFNILIFFACLSFGVAETWIARVFFVWVSVYNLFVVSIFWSLMADLFRSEQGKRLFGFIAAGGTAGAIAGPAVTALLAVPLGPANLLLVAAVLLELTLLCVRRLFRAADAQRADDPEKKEMREDQPIGGGIWAGATQAVSSLYLVGIGAYILLFTATSTFLYFHQAHLIADALPDTAARTRLFAQADLLVSTLTLFLQTLVTGRFLARYGTSAGLALLPLATGLGFLLLAGFPILWVAFGTQAVRRALEFAIAKPAREVLFTVIPRERKYKAKNFLDTVVYRGGDAASGWLHAALATGLGWSLATMALVAVPVAALWFVLAMGLGRAQVRRSAAEPNPLPAAASG